MKKLLCRFSFQHLKTLSIALPPKKNVHFGALTVKLKTSVCSRKVLLSFQSHRLPRLVHHFFSTTHWLTMSRIGGSVTIKALYFLIFRYTFHCCLM